MENLEQLLNGVDTLKNMDLRILEKTPNILRVAMPLQGNKNHLGGVYAGAIFSLVEFPFGMLCVSKFGMHEIVPVVGEVTIRFLAPANSELVVELMVSDEEWNEIERETKLHGKYKVVKELVVRDAHGKVNTIAKATYFTIDVRNKA